jgi:N-acyl amino acid synthase of PEP-CTERM/exosortase system
MSAPAFYSKIAHSREMLYLHKHFKKYFKVVPATTPQLVNEALRIRHEVYCEELGWEPESETGLEMDAYDENALHCLLMAVNSQRYIGCVRIVLPNTLDLNHSLPLQDLCKNSLYPGHPDLDAMARSEVAEVSRLAIVADFRRRKNERGNPVSLNLEHDGSIQGRRRFPYIPVGLYIGMLELASFYGVKTLYLVTERMLATHFSRLGGNLTPVGEFVEHRGKRRPYVMDVAKVLKGTSIFMRPLIWTIRKDVESALNQSPEICDAKGRIKKKWRGCEAS